MLLTPSIWTQWDNDGQVHISNDRKIRVRRDGQCPGRGRTPNKCRRKEISSIRGPKVEGHVGWMKDRQTLQPRSLLAS